MKYFHLIWAALMRRKTRTMFTWLSVIVAFILFSVLAAVRYGMLGQLSITSAERLDTTNKAAAGRPLPRSYYNKIVSVPGVTAATYFSGFTGNYKGPNNTLQVLMFSSTVFKVFPEAKLSSAQLEAWQADRQGVIVGEDLAQRMGWSVGETIPIQSNVPQQSGDSTWYFNINGIYRADMPSAYLNFFIAHYEYLNQGAANEQLHDIVSQYIVRIDDPRHAERVSTAIDALFEHSSPQTLTQSEVREALSSIRQFGNITAIVIYVGIAVFFSLLLIVGNTLSQSVQERISEFALLRVVGFQPLSIARLVFAESIILIFTGGILGLALGYVAIRMMYSEVGNVLQTFGMTWGAVAVGLGLSLIFGILSALVPLHGLIRLNIADALRAG